MASNNNSVARHSSTTTTMAEDAPRRLLSCSCYPHKGRSPQGDRKAKGSQFARQFFYARLSGIEWLAAADAAGGKGINEYG